MGQAKIILATRNTAYPLRDTLGSESTIERGVDLNGGIPQPSIVVELGAACMR